MVSIKEPGKSLNRCFFISITLILDRKMARMFFFCNVCFFVCFKAADDAMEAESEVSLQHMLSRLPVSTLFQEIQSAYHFHKPSQWKSCA